MEIKDFKPYVPNESNMAEFTVKSVVVGVLFGVLFGAATVYLSLKAGLSVSASIPIAVLAISLGRKYLGTTILENNIIQTTGSAGESIASGVVFTLPRFLFLSTTEEGKSIGADFFNYWTILTLAILGGILGTLMMIPLRRSLIVQEHGTLPYPEGTACGSVLIAGEKGGDLAKTAYQGLGVAMLYAFFQKILHVIAEVPKLASEQASKIFPSAVVSGEITPEYLGVGYIIGFRISAVLVGGGLLAWLGLIPLLATLVPADTIAEQLIKLGYLKDLATAGGPGGWNPASHSFTDTASAIYRAYIRQIGAGAVAAGGFMALLKSIPTIISSFQQSLASMKAGSEAARVRTEQDLSFKVVIFGCLALVILMVILPQIPGDGLLTKFLIAILVVVFGFFFVTVASRIVGKFFIEPKPCEPTKHQYDYDSATVIGFLRQYGLEKDFQLNLEVNHATLAGHTFQHELQVAADAGMLGSIDANRGDYQNGWDTDQFPINLSELTEAMLVILESGGITPGGINFDAKTRRNSTDLDDIFIAHIGGMDAFARALVVANDILVKSPYKKLRAERYSSFDSGSGKAFEEGKLTLEDLHSYAVANGDPKQISGKQELFENILNQYI